MLATGPEPTAHLDGATARQLATEVLGSGRDRSVVWITHGTAGRDLVDHVVDHVVDLDATDRELVLLGSSRAMCP